VTISISAEYSTVLEYVLSNLLPFILGPRILNDKMHMITILVWIGIRVYKTLSAHSGYVFPWEIFQYIPFLAYSEFHSYHHSHNDGNYGSFFVFWDYLFGTSTNYYRRKENNTYGMVDISG
jgi:sterol desaturase/sphingolipid hydroxylase (fatty acid hydroxylase superfamily)